MKALARTLVVGDVHASDQNPGSRTETYKEDILRKCWELVSLAKEQEVTSVLFLGDIFDKNVPVRVSHGLVQEIADVLIAFGVPVYVLVGNHDIASASLDTISKLPIGMLGKLPNVTLLVDQPVELCAGVEIYPIPGIPIIREEEWLSHYKTGSKSVRTIIAAHQDIVPSVDLYHPAARDHLQPAAMIAEVTDADLVLYGHIHDCHGTYKFRDTVFINLGSICRLTIADVDHVPTVHILTVKDDERRSVRKEEFRLQTTRDKEEVFLLDQKEKEKTEKVDFQETVKLLKASRVHRFSLEAVVEDIKNKKEITESVKEICLSYLEEVR